TRTLLSQCFKKEGFAVGLAADGVEACSAALSDKYDVALVDLLLPRRDGYSVLLFLRSREETRALPTLILSGESADGHPEIALRPPDRARRHTHQPRTPHRRPGRRRLRRGPLHPLRLSLRRRDRPGARLPLLPEAPQTPSCHPLRPRGRRRHRGNVRGRHPRRQ